MEVARRGRRVVQRSSAEHFLGKFGAPLRSDFASLMKRHLAPIYFQPIKIKV